AVKVEEARVVEDELVDAFNRLIPQLSRSHRPPTRREADGLVGCEGRRPVVARDDNGHIVGSLTLVLFRIPTAVRAWIEDVVVDESARGQGIGEALNREALRIAKDAGAKTVDLTSRPSREAANRLYQRIGFKQRDTNVYRYELD